MNTPQSYLETRLKACSHYELTDLDKKIINDKGIESYLFKKLTSKKFRRSKLPLACEERVKKAISQATSSGKPLQIVFPAGAYKLWSFPSSPEADWAEFFTLAHVLSYIAPILAAYTPGVQLHFYLFTYLMQKSNNINADEVDKYLKSFQLIIDEFKKYTPQNSQIKIITDAHFYERELYFSLLEGFSDKAKEVFSQFPPEKKEKYMKSSRLNIRWKGVQDWTQLSEEEKEEKVLQGALYEVKGNADFYPLIKQWVFDTDKIIIFPQMKNEFLGIGATKNSVTKYWTGFGVLEKNKEVYEARILSPSQYNSVIHLPHETISVALLPLTTLQKIEAFYEPLDFISRIPRLPSIGIDI